MLPEPSRYLAFFPRVLRHYGGGAFDHGSAYRSEDFSASAFWLPPGVGPDEEALGAVLTEAVDADRQGEVFGVLEQIGAAHPSEPHWFLPAIGVDPRRQGRGYGSALLARSLQACDRDHAVAYLEASNPRNVPSTSASVSTSSTRSRWGPRRWWYPCVARRAEKGPSSRPLVSLSPKSKPGRERNDSRV
jgi:GNAT superfamily N-acetyltransferase